MVGENNEKVPVVEASTQDLTVSDRFSFKGFSFKTLVGKNVAKVDTYVKLVLSAVVVFYAPQMLNDPNYQMALNGATFVASKLVLDVLHFFVTKVDLKK